MNWIYSNLNERLTNLTLDFEVKFNPTKFEIQSFNEASNLIAISLKNKNLFLCLSGGLDSEYILKKFYDLNIHIKPIIVVYNGNEIERKYAFRTCKQRNIEPIVLECSDSLYLNIYKNEIVNKLNGQGINSVSTLLCSKWIKNKNAILLTGNDLLYEGEANKSVMLESDFYTDILYPELKIINFFFHTPEIAYSIFKKMDNIDVQEFKSKLYNLNWRPKIRPHYTTININVNRKHILPKHTFELGNKDYLISTMEKWNES